MTSHLTLCPCTLTALAPSNPVSVHTPHCVHARVCSAVPDFFATPGTVARQAPLSMRFSQQEYWSGLPFLPPGDLLHPGIKPASPACVSCIGRWILYHSATWEAHNTLQHSSKIILLKHKSGPLTPVLWTLHRLPVSLKETQSLHSPQAAGGLTPPDPVPCASHTRSACSRYTQSLPELLHMLFLLSMTVFP